MAICRIETARVWMEEFKVAKINPIKIISNATRQTFTETYKKELRKVQHG